MNPSTNSHLVLHVAIRVLVVCIVLSNALWLLLPGGLPADAFELDSVLDTEPEGEARSPSAEIELRASMFDKQLWYTPPKILDPPLRTPTPQLAQTSCLLMAITSSIQQSGEFVRSAVIYDPDTDLVYQVRAGEHVGPFVIRAITEMAVDMEQGRLVATLTLDTPEATP